MKLSFALTTGLVLGSSTSSASDGITVDQPYLARKIDGEWKSIDVASAPPKRGEYVRVGFKYRVTEPKGLEIARQHTVENSNGRAYNFTIGYQPAQREEGTHFTYALYKIPGDAPASVEYSGYLGTKKGGGKRLEEVSRFTIPIAGEVRPLGPEIESVWIAPPIDKGYVGDRITRPVQPGEVVRLAARYYIEKDYTDVGNRLRMLYEISDLGYPGKLHPFTASCWIPRPRTCGWHTTYRTIMIPRRLVKYVYENPVEEAELRVRVQGETDALLAGVGSSKFFVSGDPVEPANPAAPGLYISKDSPRTFFDKKLKSTTNFEVGDTVFFYAVWRSSEPRLEADMIASGRFQVPEYGIDQVRARTWRFRAGFACMSVELTEEHVGQAELIGSIIADGGSGGEIAAKRPIKFRVKAKINNGLGNGSEEGDFETEDDDSAEDDDDTNSVSNNGHGNGSEEGDSKTKDDDRQASEEAKGNSKGNSGGKKK